MTIFAFCIIGGGYARNSNNFQVQIKRKDDEQIVNLKKTFIKPRVLKNNKIGIEYLQFNISNSGVYKIKIKNPEGLIVKESILKFGLIFKSNPPVKNIEILIKETTPIIKQFFGIIFLVLGLNLFMWSVILAINLDRFG